MATGLRLVPQWREKVVFYIEATGRPEDENACTSGTGFLMRTSDKVYLVTCKHILYGYQNLHMYWLNEDQQQFDVSHLELLGDDRTPLWCSPENGLDIATYEISLDAHHELEEVIEYAFATNVRSSLTYADQVFALGFPALNNVPHSWSTRFPILKSGFIAYPPQENWNGAPIILVDITLRWGFSGGLMFCQDQKNIWYILGIVFGGLSTTTGPLGELGGIVKWDAVCEFVGPDAKLVYLKK